MLHQDLDYEYTVRNQKENSSPSYCCLDTTVINGHKLAQRLCRISLLNLDPFQQQHNKLKFLHYHHTKHTQERVNNSDINTFFEVLFASNKRFLALPFTILTRNYPPFTFPSFAPPQTPTHFITPDFSPVSDGSRARNSWNTFQNDVLFFSTA